MQVVIEDKRQSCIYSLASQTSKPWLWWDFASAYSVECTMQNGKFNDQHCADEIVTRIGMNVSGVAECMGDEDSDAPHALLQASPLRIESLQCHSCLCLSWTGACMTHMQAGLCLGLPDRAGWDVSVCVALCRSTHPSKLNAD